VSLLPGHQLAHYEIIEPIGKGGMGEVYRAKDSKLGRDVAIKVLPDEFARDEERLRRFQREAKVLASLNHPNIAAIYGLEHSEGTHYLVLEMVEGETLAERIARGPIPVDEAVRIAMKIATALQEAHDRGIVHRDLKPANIKLTPDDDVKVLDFGLAKAFIEDAPDADSSMSPTITRNATRVGVILGTAAYMSPEQAKGKRVDRQTDIFAFGAVLYEMLTRQKAVLPQSSVGGQTITHLRARV
jgi:serine/threonine-protein kinase